MGSRKEEAKNREAGTSKQEISGKQKRSQKKKTEAGTKKQENKTGKHEQARKKKFREHERVLTVFSYLILHHLSTLMTINAQEILS